ncbi:ABC transporter permease subunit [Tabrizicola piscis]|uniref:ABC transporter permease subunit n=1 Tax=Tabrizicola piscis TaxID=2494374 RepID=A0A3S8U432_9RHOB|nr:ABC transporter permease subunit [Tabrizicola piscis]AZL58374.1 ABC transporter permease subunit [Tabrizicola piscis]
MTGRTNPVWLLLPVLLVLGGLFLAALGLTLIRSFRYMPVLGLTEPDLAAYAAVLSSPGFLASLGLSLWIALASTLLSAVLALGAALLLRQTFPGRQLIGFLFQMNLTVPHVVGAVGMLYLVSQSGAFARLAYAGGLITAPAQFPALTHDPFAIGVILLYVWKEVPFITLILLANLQSIGVDHEATARSLGATRWQAFRHVTLPMLMPGLLAASVLVFAFAFGAYEIPLLLGASSPKALPVLAWQSYTDVDLAARPEAMAMAVIIALLGVLMLLAYARLARPLAERGRHAR